MKRLTPDSRELKSADLVAENIERLRELFPEAFANEGKIDFDVLRQLLGDRVDDGEERYGLNWHGKRAARLLALTPSTGTLRPCPEESVDWATTQNIFIEGDNLEVLKLLQKSYAGKVKLIYIDPPYNTGKDFVYPDNFQDSIKNYLEITGQVEGGQRITSNTEASGRFHTDWLNMMYPRLKLAWCLLGCDGVMFVSLDEKEVCNFRTIANDLFGEESFVADVTVVTNLKGRNDKKHIAPCHEHIVVYGKPGFQSFGLPLTEEQRAAFDRRDEAGREYALRDLRKRGGPDRREDRPNMFFPLFWSESDGRVSLERLSPSDIEIVPLRGDGSEGRWRWGRDRVRSYLPWLHGKKSSRTGRLDVEHRVYLDPNVALFSGDSLSVEEEDEGDEDDVIERMSKPKSIWIDPRFSSDSGKRAFKELLPGDVFSFPKSTELLKQCLQIGAGKKGLVLDLFAGSGSVAQAVVELNAADGGCRCVISIQLPELLASDNRDQRAAALFCKEIGRPSTLAEIAKERIRRVIAKVGGDLPAAVGCNGGFRVFKLDSGNVRPWDASKETLAESLQAAVDHVKPDRTEDDLLYDIILKHGLDLCAPIEEKQIGSHKVRSVGGGAVFTCFGPRITQADVEQLADGIATWRDELAPANPELSRVVFRDSAFESDVAKTNLALILKERGFDEKLVVSL